MADLSQQKSTTTSSSTSSPQLEYLHVNAFSIKDAIIKHLSKNENIVGEIYPGSNLSILIDTLSYMFQILMYNLNSAAAESMFLTTELYDNIYKLCNFLGYSPKGGQPGQMLCECVLSSNTNLIDLIGFEIPKYCYIECTCQGVNETCYFSTAENITFSNQATPVDVTFYAGKWNLYDEVFVADGHDFEEFTLQKLNADITNTTFVPHNFIHVYVESSKLPGKISQWQSVTDGLFMANNNTSGNYIGNNIYNEYDEIVFVKLNPDKTYSIQFGNGVTGKKLDSGDKIYIWYLQSPTATLNINAFDINNQPIKYITNLYNSTIINTIFNTTLSGRRTINETLLTLNNIKVTNTSAVTQFRPPDTVDTIRTNAPVWFKTGNRLVTKNDYEFFVKEYYESTGTSGQLVDCKCMNNFEYMASFYKWLYDLGTRYQNDGEYYLNENTLIYNNYYFSDAADANNIYIWIKTKTAMSNRQIKLFEQSFNRIKDLTHEICFLSPIYLSFWISAAPDYLYKKYLLNNEYGTYGIDDDPSYIEILYNPDLLFNNQLICQEVAEKIADYFISEKNTKFGAQINPTEILNTILSIPGVIDVNTVFDPKELTEKFASLPEYSDLAKMTKTVVYGISLASWTSTMIDQGSDLEISVGMRKPQVFQYPIVYNIVDYINSDHLKQTIIDAILPKIKLVISSTAIDKQLTYY